MTEHFPVYDMQRRPGEPARFGVEVNSPTLELLATAGHDLRGQIYLEGGLSWQHEAETSENSGVPTGDYHEFFKIQNLPHEPEVIESKLIFWGIPQQHTHVGAAAAFITLPSTCTSKPVTYLHVDSYEAPGAFLASSNETPVAATGCNQLAFNPSLSLGAEDTGSDQPDGVTADLHVPQFTGEPSKPNSPDVQGAQVTLPEGLTLDPSAANGLLACSDAQYAEASCPEASNVGSVLVNAPGIPDGSLTGGVYVGAPEAGAGPESGGEYRMFLIATAPQYGVGLRLEGRVSANAQTRPSARELLGRAAGAVRRLRDPPTGGARAPLANPLACGPRDPERADPALHRPERHRSRCGRLLGQRMPAVAAVLAGTDAHARKSRARVRSARSPSTSRGPTPSSTSRASPSRCRRGSWARSPRCRCAATRRPTPARVPPPARSAPSRWLPARAAEPYALAGQASISRVPTAAPPTACRSSCPPSPAPMTSARSSTRSAISVGLYDGRVTVTTTLPSVVGGVPLRLKHISVDVNRAALRVEPDELRAAVHRIARRSPPSAPQDALSSPFQATDCGALAFKPQLHVGTGAKTSKAGGASIKVTVTQPAGEANIRELQLQLPEPAGGARVDAPESVPGCELRKRPAARELSVDRPCRHGHGEDARAARSPSPAPPGWSHTATPSSRTSTSC